MPNDTCGIVTTGLTALIAFAYVVFQVQHKQWLGVGTFVLVLALLATCCQFSVCRCVGDLRICLILAVLVTNVVTLPQRVSTDTRTDMETFANPEAVERDTKAAKAATSTNQPDDTMNAPSAPNTSATPSSISDTSNNGDDHQDSDENETNYVDTFSTFMETYKSVTPGQIETMTADTKDLIATQKSLMETVKSLAPVISQGREMMDTFKDY